MAQNPMSRGWWWTARYSCQYSQQSSLRYTLLILQVFNVSRFVNLHPGGRQILLSSCGRDASDAFNMVGSGFGSHHYWVR